MRTILTITHPLLYYTTGVPHFIYKSNRKAREIDITRNNSIIQSDFDSVIIVTDRKRIETELSRIKKSIRDEKVGRARKARRAERYQQIFDSTGFLMGVMEYLYFSQFPFFTQIYRAYTDRSKPDETLYTFESGIMGSRQINVRAQLQSTKPILSVDGQDCTGQELWNQLQYVVGHTNLKFPEAWGIKALVEMMHRSAYNVLYRLCYRVCAEWMQVSHGPCTHLSPIGPSKFEFEYRPKEGRLGSPGSFEVMVSGYNHLPKAIYYLTEDTPTIRYGIGPVLDLFARFAREQAVIKDFGYRGFAF